MAFGRQGYTQQYREIFQNIYLTYKKRQDLKMFLEILLSMGTIIFFLIVVLRPTSLTIAKLIKDKESREGTLAQMDQKIQSLFDAQTLFDQQQSKISLLDTAVPNVPNPEVYVRQIEGIASKNGVTILGLTIDEVTLIGKDKEEPENKQLEQIPEGAKNVDLTITISGNYQGVTVFLSDLESLRRPFLIDSFSIKSEGGEGESSLITMAAKGRTPFIK